MLKMIIVPKHARDKHREKLKKRCVFLQRLRLTAATRGVFEWMTGHQNNRSSSPESSGVEGSVSTPELLERLAWYTPAWNHELGQAYGADRCDAVRLIRFCLT